MKSFFNDKRVMVTGACGTVGSELVRQLLEDYQAEELIALDNNESALFFLEQRFSKHPEAHFFEVGDTALHALVDPDQVAPEGGLDRADPATRGCWLDAFGENRSQARHDPVGGRTAQAVARKKGVAQPDGGIDANGFRAQSAEERAGVGIGGCAPFVAGQVDVGEIEQ